MSAFKEGSIWEKKKKKPVIAWFVDQLHLVKKRAKEIVLSSNATKSGKIFEATYMLFFSHMISETVHASLLAVYIHETMQIFHVKGPRLPHWQHNYTWTSTKLHLRDVEHHLKNNLFKNTNMLSNLFYADFSLPWIQLPLEGLGQPYIICQYFQQISV